MTDSMPNMMYYMPVVPSQWGGYPANYGNSGNDMFGGNWMWFLLVWMAMFGWGNGGFGFGGGGNSAGFVSADIQRGFDQSALTTGIAGIRTDMCAGFANTNQAISNGFAQAEIAANSRQMADMNQNFAMQSAFQQCCCDNRMATADTKYAIATEACANRNALAMSTRDIIDNDNRNHQAVMDKLCQLEMDGYKQQVADRDNTIAQLRNQLLVASDREFTNNQTATIQAGQRALANEIEQYVLPTPRPAYIVQNPNCCNPMGYGYSQCA